MLWLETFFLLLCGHALADFVLQPAEMGYGKNRKERAKRSLSPHFPAWQYWLSAHALIHGGAVYLITGQLVYGLIETASHWLIDFAKCEGKISMHVDQVLHILLKLSYSLLIASQLP